MTMYNIYYKGDICGNPRTYEITTDNFEKWLKWFNEERIEEVICLLIKVILMLNLLM